MLKPMLVKAKDFIWLEGTSPDAIYFLLKGRVNYISYESVTPDDVASNKRVPIIFKKMISGSYFGEIEIILRKKRSHSLQAGVDSELFYISRQDFDGIIVKEFPHIAEEMKVTALEREKRNWRALEDLRKFIRQIQVHKERQLMKRKTSRASFGSMDSLSEQSKSSKFDTDTAKRSDTIYRKQTNHVIEEENSDELSSASSHKSIKSKASLENPRKPGRAATISPSKRFVKKKTHREKDPKKLPLNLVKRKRILRRIHEFKSFQALYPAGFANGRRPSMERNYLREILSQFVESRHNSPVNKITRKQRENQSKFDNKQRRRTRLESLKLVESLDDIEDMPPAQRRSNKSLTDKRSKTLIFDIPEPVKRKPEKKFSNTKPGGLVSVMNEVNAERVERFRSEIDHAKTKSDELQRKILEFNSSMTETISRLKS
jgi:CRP-like cAMP-binding protein